MVVTASGLPIEGQTYSLTCDLMGDESLAVTQRSIRWDRVTPTPQMGIHRTNTLTFNPLRRDDEGQYRCTTNIITPYLNDSLTRINITSIDVDRK